MGFFGLGVPIGSHAFKGLMATYTYVTYEPYSKLLVSPVLTLMVVPYLRSLDYSSYIECIPRIFHDAYVYKNANTKIQPETESL